MVFFILFFWSLRLSRSLGPLSLVFVSFGFFAPLRSSVYNRRFLWRNELSPFIAVVVVAGAGAGTGAGVSVEYKGGVEGPLRPTTSAGFATVPITSVF